MRGGTAFCIVETVGAEVGTLYLHNLHRFYGFANCLRNIFTLPRRPSSVRAAPCQLPPREAPKPSPPGKGDRRRRWMRERYGVLHCRNSRRRGRDAVPSQLTTLLRIRQLFAQCFTPPRRPSSVSPCGRASFPQGKLLYRAFRCMVYRSRTVNSCPTFSWILCKMSWQTPSKSWDISRLLYRSTVSPRFRRYWSRFWSYF